MDYDYKVGDKVLVINKGILRKAESNYVKEPCLKAHLLYLVFWDDLSRFTFDANFFKFLT
jgi:hypothetical protein